MKNVATGKAWPWLIFALPLIAMVAQLRNQGRIWWCACSQPNLWDGDIWSAHTSQHLFDPYSFTHVLHGVVFFGLIWWALPQICLIWRLWIAICIECFWEIFENTQLVIQRYREATIGLGYEGDTIANSMSDILCCTLGFILARHFGLRRSVILFVVVELVLLFWIRDNLTLNVLMLICPIDAIKSWQMIH